MPPHAATAGGDAQGGSRSTDLTRNLLATRTSLESHFNSFARRESEFRRAKLVLLDRQLHVQRQALNSEKRNSSPTGGDGQPRSLSRAGALAIQRAEEIQRSEEESGFRSTEPLSSRLGRSKSSPGLLGKKGEASPRTRSGRHGSASLADSRDAPEAQSAGTFCVTRFGAQYPTSHHPAPHPGTSTSRPHSKSRSVGRRREASTAAAKVARSRTLAVTVAAEPEEVTVHEAPPVCESPAGSMCGTLRLPLPDNEEALLEPLSLGAHSTWAPSPMHGSSSSPARFRPASSAPANRWNFATAALDHREENDPVLAAELELFAEEEKAFAELGCYAGTRQHSSKDKPKTIQRLGDFMTLLGPRYKAVSKEMLFKRSEVGDLGSFQRRLQREKYEQQQRGLATGVAGHRVKMLGLSSSESQLPRTVGLENKPDLLADPDGVARSAWLHARAQEVERRARTGFDASVPNPDQILNKSFNLPTKKDL